MDGIPNRDRRSERREATRREILDAAWQIARRDGIAALTLREVAAVVGMKPPSLYSHFDSKNAVYDAMYAESWSAVIGWLEQRRPLPTAPRKALLAQAEAFFDFATADLARYQLMNQRTIPDFVPSGAAYAVAVDAYESMGHSMRGFGVTAAGDLDLWTALLTGLADQQLANDPGGTRWRRQLTRVVDMFADEVGIPGPTLRRKR